MEIEIGMIKTEEETNRNAIEKKMATVKKKTKIHEGSRKRK